MVTQLELAPCKRRWQSILILVSLERHRQLHAVEYLAVAVIAWDVGLSDVLLQDDAVFLCSKTERLTSAVIASTVVVRIGFTNEQYQRAIVIDGNGGLYDVTCLDGNIVLGIACLACNLVGKPFCIKVRIGKYGIFVSQMVCISISVIIIAYIVSLVLVTQNHIVGYLVIHPHAILHVGKPDVPYCIFLRLPVSTKHRIAVIVFEVTGTATWIVNIQVELRIDIFKDKLLDHQRLCRILALVDIAIGVFHGVERQPFVDCCVLTRCTAL